MILEGSYTLEGIDEVAATIAQLSDEYSLFLFYGDLGAGKTTLIKRICKQLGCINDGSSPSFSLINEYSNLSSVVYHIDLYRLNRTEEAFQIGIEEYLFSGHVCLIEWPQIIVPLLEGEKHIAITLESDGHNRTIKIKEIF